MDSRNLIDIMLGKSDKGRDHLIQQGINMESIRKGDWKYVPPGNVRNRGKIGINNLDEISEPGALFYLPEDPAEQNNVAHLYPSTVKELRDLLTRELGDKSGKDAPAGKPGGTGK